MHADVRSLIGVNRCFIGGSLLLGGNEVARYVFLVRTKFTNRSKFASRSWHGRLARGKWEAAKKS